MKFSRLKQASDYEVRDWLKKELALTDYQVNKMNDNETIRWAPFEFYAYRKDEYHSKWWRLTIPLWVIYWILASLASIIAWCFTGNMGLGRKFLDNFHYPWANKINI